MVSAFNRRWCWRATASLAVLVACDAGRATGAVRSPYAIVTDRAQYPAGSTGTVTIRNASEATLDPNVCDSQIERQHLGVWIVVSSSPAPGVQCALIGFEIEPGQQMRIPFEVPGSLGRGTYRLEYENLRAGDAPLTADQRSSGSFDVP